MGVLKKILATRYIRWRQPALIREETLEPVQQKLNSTSLPYNNNQNWCFEIICVLYALAYFEKNNLNKFNK